MFTTTKNLSPKEAHHHSLISLIVAGVLAFMCGLVFWFVTSNQSSPTKVADVPSDTRAEVAALLMNAKNQASQEEINSVVQKITSSKVKVTDADRAKVAASLENI